MSALLLITGASSGLGLAIARSVPFAASVVDISRSGPPEGSGIDHLRADLADPASWNDVGRDIAARIHDAGAARTMLVHGAGTLTPIGFAGEVDADAYQRNVLLNSASGQVLGHHYLAAVRDLSGNHGIVMITSGAATSIYPGWSSYGAGKAALDQWVRVVGAEQAERGGASVVAVAPGVVATDMQSEIRSVDSGDFPRVHKFRDLHASGDLTEPDEAARRFWEVIEAGTDPGEVIDLRDRF